MALSQESGVIGKASCGALAEAPVFFILLSVCTSAALHDWLPGWAAVAAGTLVASASLLLCTRTSVIRWKIFFGTVVLFSMLFSGLSCLRLSADVSFPDSFSFTGRVLSRRPWGKSTALLLSTPYGRAYATLPSDKAPREGAEIYARVSSFALKSAAKGFDEKKFWRAKGAARRLVVFELRELSPPSGTAAWRGSLEKLYSERLLPLSHAYISALTTGRRDTALFLLHKKAGTSHLLAISGFHLGILAALLLFLFRNTALQLPVVSCFLWLYTALAGFPPGCVRAALLVQLCLLSRLAGRPSCAFNSVSTALLLMLLWNPWYFFDVGFRFSALAALFISAASPFLGGGFSGAVFVSLLVWFVTAPLAASVFKEVPVAGLFLNIIAVPWFSLIFPMVLLLSVPALIGFSQTNSFSLAAEALLAFSEHCLAKASELLPISAGYTYIFAALACGIFAAAVSLRCGCRLLFAPLIAVIFILFLSYCPGML